MTNAKLRATRTTQSLSQLEEIPYMLVVGQKEAQDGVVAVRHQKRGDLGVKPLADFLAQIQEEVKTRTL